MTTIVKDKTSSLDTAYLVNGKRVYVDRAESITAEENGYSWIVKTDWFTYKVFGGKKSGGSRYEWFLEDVTNGEGGDIYPVKSAVAALSLIDHM